jgi:26S proteasome regulatory subunit N5
VHTDATQAGILSRKISTRYFARRPKKTPEQLEKDQKEREEKEKNRSADDPPIEPEDDVTDLKLRFYEQQITLAKHDNKYLDVCKHYRQVLDTEAVEEDPNKLRAVCEAFVTASAVLTSL